MAQPTAYTRQADFSDYSSNYPSTPHSGSSLDNEFDALKTTVDEILANMALIQRDDGDLANRSVGIDQLASDIEIGFRTVTNWTTATAYRLRDGVFTGGALYRCIVAHTSGTFSTDLTAEYWTLIYDYASAPGYTIGTDIQAWDADLDAIAALAKTDGNFIVGNGTTWVAESGATARASLGLAIGSDVQAYSSVLTALASNTIDGVVIGGSTPAAGSFTTVAASTSVTAASTMVMSGTQIEQTNASGLQLNASHASGGIYFRINGSERVRIDSSGNVGIGTNSPNYSLDVFKTSAGAITTALNLRNDDATVGTGVELAFTAFNSNTITGAITNVRDGIGTYSLRFSNWDGSSNTERVRIDSSGNVGINESSPDYKLDVNGTFGFTPGTSVTPVDNGDMTFYAPDNTTFTVAYKGSDGTVRTGTITLS